MDSWDIDNTEENNIIKGAYALFYFVKIENIYAYNVMLW